MSTKKQQLKESLTPEKVEYIVVYEKNDDLPKRIRKADYDASVIASDSSKPLTYKSIISQGTTNPPYDDKLDGSGSGTPFVDTLGGTWSYNTTGTFYYTKTGAFSDIDKINVELSYNNGSNQSIDTVIYWDRLNDDTLRFYTGTSNSYVAPSIITLANSKMYLQPITIEVYS